MAKKIAVKKIYQDPTKIKPLSKAVLFDVKQFGIYTRAFLEKNEISWSRLRVIINTTSPTIGRVLNGENVQMEVYFKLCQLMQVPIDSFKKQPNEKKK